MVTGGLAAGRLVAGGLVAGALRLCHEPRLAPRGAGRAGSWPPVDKVRHPRAEGLIRLTPGGQLRAGSCPSRNRDTRPRITVAIAKPCSVHQVRSAAC